MGALCNVNIFLFFLSPFRALCCIVCCVCAVCKNDHVHTARTWTINVYRYYSIAFNFQVVSFHFFFTLNFLLYLMPLASPYIARFLSNFMCLCVCVVCVSFVVPMLFWVLLYLFGTHNFHLITFFAFSVYYLFLQYPLVRDNIQGEETAKFTNALGESIELEISDDPAKTAECILKILDGNSEAADLLAAEVHKNVVCTTANVENLPELVIVFSLLLHSVWCSSAVFSLGERKLNTSFDLIFSL